MYFWDRLNPSNLTIGKHSDEERGGRRAGRADLLGVRVRPQLRRLVLLQQVAVPS